MARSELTVLDPMRSDVVAKETTKMVEVPAPRTDAGANTA